MSADAKALSFVFESADGEELTFQLYQGIHPALSEDHRRGATLTGGCGGKAIGRQIYHQRSKMTECITGTDASTPIQSESESAATAHPSRR